MAVVKSDDDAGLVDDLLSAAGALRRAARRATGRPFPLDQVAGAQMDLVRLVRRHPGISINEASLELGIMPNTVSTLVRQLIERGILARTQDQVDRRIARLSLTPEARQRAEQMRDERTALVTAVIRELDRADRAALARGIAVIRKLTAEMTTISNSEQLGA